MGSSDDASGNVEFRLHARNAKDRAKIIALYIGLGVVLLVSVILFAVTLGQSRNRKQSETDQEIGALDAVSASVVESIEKTRAEVARRKKEIATAKSIKDEKKRLEELNRILNKGRGK